MKALSKTNRARHDKFKTDLMHNKQLLSTLTAEGERIKKDHDKEASAEKKVGLLIESERLLTKAKSVSDTITTEREKFFKKHSSEGSKQYQKRIELN